jgi:hypothetical protein
MRINHELLLSNLPSILTVNKTKVDTRIKRRNINLSGMSKKWVGSSHCIKIPTYTFLEICGNTVFINSFWKVACAGHDHNHVIYTVSLTHFSLSSERIIIIDPMSLDLYISLTFSSLCYYYSSSSSPSAAYLGETHTHHIRAHGYLCEIVLIRL